ncbi:hypothetical protein [Paenibacillus sp. QZ-Y1]|uniref:hypothetical protein n=1 Tax=Paenibacillus sp. QZ-Y1 TaxID=3414511 RepID=UPI003F7A1EAB
MKCAACEHSYELSSWEEGYEQAEDFIHLRLSNEVEVLSGGGMWESAERHQLFACPKCGTVKIQVWNS